MARSGSTIDTAFWNTYSGGAPDEWGLCVHLGSQCGPVLEHRYATWITPTDIDKLASAGVTILRIPTHYAAWVKVPGSQLYTGNQVSFLKSIATYAITKHNMHIVIDIHSLPGGVNGMPFGERQGGFDWFNNATALNYSYQAVSAALSYIQAQSGYPQSYTLEPINEPVDNRDVTSFGQTTALSDAGATYVANYIKGVYTRAAAVNSKIPIMLQGSFKGEAYWSPTFPPATYPNLVYDQHNYYFAGRPTDSNTVSADICSDAKSSVGDGSIPVWIGEWSIQTVSNNLYANRAKNVNTGLYAFGKYDHGSAYWTAKFTGNATVVGQGTQQDYWNYETFIDLGFINPSQGAAYCA